MARDKSFYSRKEVERAPEFPAYVYLPGTETEKDLPPPFGSQVDPWSTTSCQQNA